MLQKSRAKSLIFAILGVSALIFAFMRTRPQISHLIVESAPRQTLKGWGVFPCTIRNDRPDFEDYTLWKRPVAQKLLFAKLGATLFRSEILPGSYDARKNDGSLDFKTLDDSLVRQIQLGQKWGLKTYFLSIWSPPALFKFPATTLGQDPKTRQNSRLRADKEAAFCVYVVRVFDYLTKTRKLPAPVAFSVQNEPGYAAPLWNGAAMTPAQWQRLIVQMRAVLDANGYRKTLLIGPEGGSYAMSIAFVGGPNAPALKNQNLKMALGGFAFHGYTKDSKYEPQLSQLRQIALQSQKSGRDVWMSEWSLTTQKQTPLEHALIVSQRLAREMTFVPCNYWSWWQGYYPRHPKGEVLLTGRDDNALHISKTYYVLQKLWHSAPAGSVVHRISSDDAQVSGFANDKVQAVAFSNPRGQTLLLINPTKSAKNLQISGLHEKSATPFLTDETRDMKALAPVKIQNGEIDFSLGAHSIAVVEIR